MADDDTEDRRPQAAPHAVKRLARRVLTPAQAKNAARWATKHGWSEAYGILYHSLPHDVMHWSVKDIHEVVLALQSIGSIKQVSIAIADALKPSFDALTKRVEAIESELKALQLENTALRQDLANREYLGVWDQRAYKRGNSVTHGGHLWICKSDTQHKPGTSTEWQLAVRRGRDARAWEHR